jgi:hypothetical protein
LHIPLYQEKKKKKNKMAYFGLWPQRSSHLEELSNNNMIKIAKACVERKKKRGNGIRLGLCPQSNTMLRGHQRQCAVRIARAVSEVPSGSSQQCRHYTSSPRTQKQSGNPAPSSSDKASGKARDTGAAFPMAPSKNKDDRHRTQYNVDPFSLLPTEDHYTFPLVTAASLAQNTTRPRKVRMLARDFIHDSLYNPRYGYFSRHAVLLPDGAKQTRNYDFPTIRNDRDFMAAVEERYSEFEMSLQQQTSTPTETREQQKKPYAFSKEGMEAAQIRGKMDAARQAQSDWEAGEHDRDVKAMAARQVWHTPTELFKVSMRSKERSAVTQFG